MILVLSSLDTPCQGARREVDLVNDIAKGLTFSAAAIAAAVAPIDPRVDNLLTQICLY